MNRPNHIFHDESIFPFTEVGICGTCGNYYFLQLPVYSKRNPLNSLHKAIAISDADPVQHPWGGAV